jgi:transposase
MKPTLRVEAPHTQHHERARTRQVSEQYQMSQRYLHRLLARYRAEGLALRRAVYLHPSTSQPPTKEPAS